MGGFVRVGGAISMAELRRRLHRCAEPSNQERETAATIRDELLATGADDVVEGLGGHGVAAVYAGGGDGPRVLLRCDMDAVPVAESSGIAHASKRGDVSHKCGHDGHMAMMVGVARHLGRQRPERGRVVLLFQPAEETGEGARRVLDDPRFEPLRPDYAIALHNVPGVELGTVVIRSGPFASASIGMVVELSGVESHASEPHLGISPVQAAAAIAQAVESAPQRTARDEHVQATVVGLHVGKMAFGTSPGYGRVMATLRAREQSALDALVAHCEELSREIAAAHRVGCDVAWADEFPATTNDPRVADAVVAAARTAGLPTRADPAPFPWSEDFGHICAAVPGALFGLGSGIDQPALHHPDYDFPDQLLDTGTGLLLECASQLLSASRREDGPR